MLDCPYKKYEPLFGSWYITDKLGEGAIARVYSLERQELGVSYHAALKAITIPTGEEEVRSIMADGMTGENLTHYYQTIIKNIVSELKYMSRLKGHSHIVSYEDHQIIEHEGDIGWDILIRIEKLTPLIEHSLQHPLTEEDVIQLGIDICKALEYCRQFDILHRDVKPENIFIAPGGGYKLGDFGIAKIVEETQIGLSRKGTYTYMAPEVYRGGVYGPTADIYSLGLVMYKYLNDDRNPFMPSYPSQVDVDDYDSAFAKRISGVALPQPAHGSDRLKELVLRACAYDPSARYRTAGDLREDLEHLQFQTREKVRLDLTEQGRDPVQKEQKTQRGERNPQQERKGQIRERATAREDRRQEKTEARGQGGRSGRVLRIGLAAAVFLFLVAGVIDAVIPDKVTAIRGIGDEEKIYIGEQLHPTYRIEPDWFEKEPITFETEDDDVASVDRVGSITANKVGETKLTMTARDYTQEATLKVIPKITKIGGVDKEIRLEEGSTKKLKPTLSPEKFEDEPIKYKSRDKSVVTVSKEGKMTGKAPGETTVIISSGGCRKKVSVEVYAHAEPVVTYTPSDSAPRRSSGSSHKTGSSSGSGKGYFNKKDDEYF